jgi:hypothetical protein
MSSRSRALSLTPERASESMTSTPNLPAWVSIESKLLMGMPQSSQSQSGERLRV